MCIVLCCTVPSGVTTEAEAAYGQCRGQINSTQCAAPLMYASYVFCMNDVLQLIL